MTDRTMFPGVLQRCEKMTDRTTFPGIYNCLKLLATVPVTTSQCERTISVLRRFKAYLRNTMCQDRFSALASEAAVVKVNIRFNIRVINIHHEFKHDN